MKRGVAPLLWIFGVIFALIPLVFDYQHERLANPAASWISVVLHGELLLVALAILGDAIARACVSDDNRLRRAILALGSFLVACLVINEAVQIREAVERFPQLDLGSYLAARIASDSLWGFGFAVILSLATLVVVED